ncbi:membrane protein insertion efficiency factor YidD [Candidatus Peregrinibacteria bacterium]|nr:membrane protein insertion efficiency factor YidD [Candidatus Peregrinibacteria bacterium]MBT4056202.1 membrane protein insertion efficiency factor YidD [Candidatus Peregrinibacteria bacterium]
MKFWLWPQKAVLFFIRWYQVNFSPDHSERGKQRYPLGYCRFQPSCSEYGHNAIKKYGVIWGGLKAFWRVLRCNRFSKGGWDPVE